MYGHSQTIMRTQSTYGIFARGRTESSEAEILMMLRRGMDGRSYIDFPGGVVKGGLSKHNRFVEMLRTTDMLCGSSESHRPFKDQKTQIGKATLRLPLSVAKTERPPHAFRIEDAHVEYYFYPMLLTPNEGKYWAPRARALVRRNVNEDLGDHGFAWFSLEYVKENLRKGAFLENIPVSRWVHLFFSTQKDWLSGTLLHQYIDRRRSNGFAVVSSGKVMKSSPIVPPTQKKTYEKNENDDIGVGSTTNSKPKSSSSSSSSSSNSRRGGGGKKSPYSPLRARAPTFEYIGGTTASSSVSTKSSKTTEKIVAEPQRAPKPKKKPLSWTRDIVGGVKIVSWNLLCDGKNYALSGHHGYCKDEYLSWKQHRGPMIIDRLAHLDADIMCVQEVNARMLNDIMHALSARGYVLAGFRLKDMNDIWGTCVDYNDSFGYPMGVATIVKASTIHIEGKFFFHSLTQSSTYSPTQLPTGVKTVNLRDSFGDYVRDRDISKNNFLPLNQYVTEKHLNSKFHPDPAINTLMKRNDCAVFTKLRHVNSSTRLLVANTHLFWNPQPPGVKSIQAFLTHYAMLRFGSECKPKYDSSNICICGDLNSDIFSPGQHDGAIMLLSEGILPISHPEHPCHSSKTKFGWSNMILTGGGGRLRSTHQKLLIRSEKSNTIQISRRADDIIAGKRISTTTTTKLSPHSSEYVPGSPGKSSENKKSFNTLSLVTTRVPTYEGWIDHIFVSRSHLCVLDLLSLPYDSKKEGKRFGPIPNKTWPSDHVVIGAVLGGGNLGRRSSSSDGVDDEEDELVTRKWSTTSGASETISESSTLSSRGRISSFSSFDEDNNSGGPTLVANHDEERAEGQRKGSEGQSLLGRLLKDSGLSPMAVNRRLRRAHSAPSYGLTSLTPAQAKQRLSTSKVANEILSLFRRAIEDE